MTNETSHHAASSAGPADTSPRERLTDPFGRHIEYVRLSVTDRCNQRCFYCLPRTFRDFQEPESWLSFDEIVRVIGAFAALGVGRVRLTGGEPLVRRHLPELAASLAGLPGIDDLSLSTNAALLGQHAQALHDAGVSRINVSLDSLQANRYREITGGVLAQVMDGLMTARSVGFSPIKINMVAMKGVNDDEFESMTRFCMEHGFTLRFIETMPMGASGQQATEHYVDLRSVREQLDKRFGLIPGVMPGGGPARYAQVRDDELRIGFITPISQHFCATCNRVRLSVDGTLYLCLGQEHSVALRPLLRDGISDAQLRDVLRSAIALKPERHEFSENPQQIGRFMSMTGG